MGFLELTPHQDQIIRTIISQGFEGKFVWPYFLSDIKKIGTKPNIRTCIDGLESFGLIELRKNGNRKNYGLTFKGLLLALKNGIINPSEARDFRLKNNINLPWETKIEQYGKLDIYTKTEKKYPADFYNFLIKSINFDSFEVSLMISRNVINEIIPGELSAVLRYLKRNQREKLDEDERELFEEVLKLFPSLNNRDVVYDLILADN